MRLDAAASRISDAISVRDALCDAMPESCRRPSDQAQDRNPRQQTDRSRFAPYPRILVLVRGAEPPTLGRDVALIAPGVLDVDGRERRGVAR
jgi:hypothetical protein